MLFSLLLYCFLSVGFRFVCGNGTPLFHCSFENGWCGITQTRHIDQFDWSINFGPTPSSETGPDFDHTPLLNGTGKYAYAEASFPRKKGDEARVDLPTMSLDSDSCLQFWYFMFGRGIGRLDLLLNDSFVWGQDENKGYIWLPYSFTLHRGVSMLSFVARRGDDYTSDIALDDVSVSRGVCVTGKLETTSRSSLPCVPNPCQHGALCVPRGMGFSCRCLRGYIGRFCEGGSPCYGENPCKNNGVCREVGTSFRCDCPVNYQGRFCETRILGPCDKQPCQNGVCQVIGTSFQCACPNAYTGILCDLRNYCYDLTSVALCKNGASCTSLANGAYTCICRPGFSGTNCQLSSISPCQARPCLNRGVCIVKNNGSFECRCPELYHGPRCEYKKQQPCQTDTCKNGGICQVSDERILCVCSPQYYGHRCELKRKDACSSNPCSRGGTCVTLSRSRFRCICPRGILGRLCTTNVDECFSSPCLNNGVCVDQVGYFQCICELDYTGTRCESRIPRRDGTLPPATTTTFAITTSTFRPGSPCAKQPCRNGGTCVNLSIRWYKCLCPVTFAGQQCERRVMTDKLWGCNFNGDFCGMDNAWLDLSDGWIRRRGPGPHTPYTGPLYGGYEPQGPYAILIPKATNYGKEVILRSPVIAGGRHCVTFWYYMYGKDMGELQVEVRWTDRPLLTIKGNQGPQWKRAYVQWNGIAAQLDWIGIIKDSPLGNIALDDLMVYFGWCWKVTPKVIYPKPLPADYFKGRDSGNPIRVLTSPPSTG